MYRVFMRISTMIRPEDYRIDEYRNGYASRAFVQRNEQRLKLVLTMSRNAELIL